MKIFFTKERIEALKKYLEGDNSILKNMNKNARKHFKKVSSNYFILGGKLFLSEANSQKEVVANDDHEGLNKIIKDIHFPDHLGMKSTYLRMSMFYVGFKRAHVNKFVADCIICQRNEPLKRVSPMVPIISEGPWNIVQMDCIDMRQYSMENDGNGWILNILDCYSKYLFSFPMINKSMQSVLEKFRLVVVMLGPPTILQTDNGKEFVNRLMIEFLNQHGIEIRRGRPRHPQNQGQVERVNQTITRRLGKYLSGYSHNRWIDVLDTVVLKYNTNWHRATNISPMMAFYGRRGVNDSLQNEISDESNESSLSLEDDRLVEANATQHGLVNEEYSQRYLQKMINDYDVHYRNISFDIGDIVIIASSFDNNSKTRKKKFDNFFEAGVWVIVEKISNHNFKVQSKDDPNVFKVVCKNSLKKISTTL